MLSRRALVVPLLAVLPLAALLAPVTAAHAAPEAAGEVRFAGAAIDMGASTLTGALEPTRTITVDLALTRPDPAGEAAYERAVYAPGDASYHRFLTPASFAARFGVDTATYDRAVAFATAHGMTVASHSEARDFLSLTGTVAQADATFAVHEQTWTYRGATFFANDVAPLVPASLPVSGIFGLEDVHRSHLPSRRTEQDVCVSGTCTGDTTPQDLWSIYDQPATATGKGVQLAIFGEGATQYVIDDLRTWEKEHGLRQVPVTVLHADPKPLSDYTSTDGDVEWQIDTQSSTGMAPDTDRLDMVWGVDLGDASTLNVLNTWLDTDIPAASASYSECEPALADIGGIEEADGVSLPAVGEPLLYSSGAYTNSYEAGLTKGVLEGKTLFSSSGDTGSSCDATPAGLNGATNDGSTGVGFPGSSPHAVDVGGTVLYGTENTRSGVASDAKRTEEYAWTYSGGGPSQVFAEPAYQTSSAALTPTTSALLAVNTPCRNHTDGTPYLDGTICRKTPDVSAQSGDIVTNGYSIYADGGDTSGGGTSLSSPMTLGLWTRVQSAYVAAGGKGTTSTTSTAVTARSTAARTTTVAGLGFANYTFYAHPADFFDPGGTTDSIPGANGAYASGPGYDYVTGLGVIDVAKLIASVVPKATAGGSSGGATAGSSSGTASGTASGGASGANGALATTGGDPLLPVVALGLLAAGSAAVALRGHRR